MDPALQFCNINEKLARYKYSIITVLPYAFYIVPYIVHNMVYSTWKIF